MECTPLKIGVVLKIGKILGSTLKNIHICKNNCKNESNEINKIDESKREPSEIPATIRISELYGENVNRIDAILHRKKVKCLEAT